MEPETHRVFGRAYFLIQALEVVAREPQPDDSSEHQNKDRLVDHKDHVGFRRRKVAEVPGLSLLYFTRPCPSHPEAATENAWKTERLEARARGEGEAERRREPRRRRGGEDMRRESCVCSENINMVKSGHTQASWCFLFLNNICLN